MRLDLPPAGDLGVEGLAVGVVPVLVDPAEGGVVGPGRFQVLGVELGDDLAEGRGRDGEEPGQADLAEEAG